MDRFIVSPVGQSNLFCLGRQNNLVNYGGLKGKKIDLLDRNSKADFLCPVLPSARLTLK